MLLTSDNIPHLLETVAFHFNRSLIISILWRVSSSRFLSHTSSSVVNGSVNDGIPNYTLGMWACDPFRKDSCLLA